MARVQALNPVRGGEHQGVEVGESRWTCRLDTTPLSKAQAGEYKWLIASLNGVLNTLFLFDAARTRPLAYADIDDDTNGNALIGRTARKIGLTTRTIGLAVKPWGSPRIVAWSRSDGTITLKGLLASAAITAGDYGHCDDGAARRLFILDDATADANGTATLRCEPRPPDDSSRLPLAFTMEEASAEMVVIDAQSPFSAPVTHRVTLQAVQIIRSNSVGA